MNEELNNTALRAGDFISENAVRAALDRRGRALPTDPAGAQPASRSRRLRRWSVERIRRAGPGGPIPAQPIPV